MIERYCHSCKKRTHSNKVTIKCCDYFPFIPNYQVGSGLIKNYKIWNTILLKKEIIKQPLGIYASKKLKDILRLPYDSKKENSCYFYNLNSGQCNIWEDRPISCEEYFCDLTLKEKSIQIKEAKFKKSSFDQEMNLAQITLFEMGFTLPEIQLCIDDFNKNKISDKLKCIFDTFDNSLEFFYRDCYFNASSCSSHKSFT